MSNQRVIARNMDEQCRKIKHVGQVDYRCQKVWTHVGECLFGEVGEPAPPGADSRGGAGVVGEHSATYNGTHTSIPGAGGHCEGLFCSEAAQSSAPSQMDSAKEVYEYVNEWLRHIAAAEIPQRPLDINAIRVILERHAAYRTADQSLSRENFTKLISEAIELRQRITELEEKLKELEDIDKVCDHANETIGKLMADIEQLERKLAAFEHANVLANEAIATGGQQLADMERQLQETKQQRDAFGKDGGTLVGMLWRLGVKAGFNPAINPWKWADAEATVWNKLEELERKLAEARQALRRLFDVYKQDGNGHPPTYGRISIDEAWKAAERVLGKGK